MPMGRVMEGERERRKVGREMRYLWDQGRCLKTLFTDSCLSVDD
jgi:hypothetical protein